MPANRSAIGKREWAAVALALALLAAAALRPSVRGNDGVGHYVYLASLLRGGDLDFADEYRLYDKLKDYPYRFAELPVDPRTGRATNRYGIGAALLWSPFVLATHAALKAADPARADAVSRPYEAAVGVATAFWASLGLALLYGRLRRVIGWGGAAAACAGLVLATPLGFYMYAHGSMSHGVSFFAAVVLLLAFERAWLRPGAAALAWFGAWSALLVMIRFQDATWVLVLGLALTWRLGRAWPGAGRGATRIAAGIAGFFAIFWLQMAVWRVIYGSWVSGPAPYLNSSAGEFERWPTHLWEVLFSERGGVLAWHPLIAAGLVGLIAMARGRGERPDWRVLGAVGLAGFAAQLWLVASWSAWWGGASFGNRFFISALPFAGLGLGELWRRLGSRRVRAAALVLLGALIVWNLGLLVQYATQMVPREDAVPWSRVIRQNVIDVPRLLLDKARGR